MTTSRVVRGTKARIFIYVGAVLIITGLIACYNNTLSQLTESRKSSEICHQQEENLSTQLQVISDYKQRLEKSLKTEKVEHQQAKAELENKLNDERIKNGKATSEANLRFNSLQQHFNLLQTQHDDFKEECSKTQNAQLTEINDLQAKLKEVQEELKKVESSRENLRTQLSQLQTEKESFEKQSKDSNLLVKQNQDLRDELGALKKKCSAFETLQAPIVEAGSRRSAASNFNKQVQVKSGEYQIQEKAQLAEPNSANLKASSRSTTSSSGKVSLGSLNGARPLLLPTVTPKSPKPSSSAAAVQGMPLPLPYKKLPEGVVPVPENPLEKKTDDANNEGAVNNRYRNKMDTENGAHEVLDPHNGNGAYDALGFGDQLNEPAKNVDKQSHGNNGKHIDTLGVGVGEKEPKNYDGVDYKENVPLEENDPEEDDDGEEYAGDHLARQKDPAVRN